MINFGAKIDIFGLKLLYYGFLWKRWRLLSFLVNMKASDTTCSWKKSHLTHKWPQNTHFPVKNAIFGPKLAVLKTFSTWMEFFTIQNTCSIFRYLLLLKMTPLKFIYSPKTAFLPSSHYCQFWSKNNGTVFPHRRRHFSNNIVFFP